MKEASKHAVLEAIRNHPEIVDAAITGSLARQGGEDQYSDLDILLVARDEAAVRDVRAWLPRRFHILICQFHLTHYCTVLSDSFEKIDLAIFSVDEPSANWVVHDYKVLKGDHNFEVQLAGAAADAHSKRAAHLNPDVSMDNILRLLTTAWKRTGRGEDLSAHAFVAMAAEMVISLERRQRGVGADMDLLDPRRRLEETHAELAGVLHRSLFVAPRLGMECLAKYVLERHGGSLSEGQARVLDALAGS